MTSDFQKQLQDILKDYKEDVSNLLNGTAEELAVEGALRLKETSPRGKSKKKHYADGWAIQQVKVGLNSFSYVIYNKNKPWLTMLLERPHLLRNGKTYTPDSAGHIKDVEDWVIDEYLKRVQEAIRR